MFNIDLSNRDLKKYASFTFFMVVFASIYYLTIIHEMFLEAKGFSFFNFSYQLESKMFLSFWAFLCGVFLGYVLTSLNKIQDYLKLRRLNYESLSQEEIIFYNKCESKLSFIVYKESSGQRDFFVKLLESKNLLKINYENDYAISCIKRPVITKQKERREYYKGLLLFYSIALFVFYNTVLLFVQSRYSINIESLLGENYGFFDLLCSFISRFV